MHRKIIKEALTYDDVLLVPQKSEILGHQVSLQTQFTRNSKNESCGPNCCK